MIRFFRNVLGTLKLFFYKICYGKRLKWSGLPRFSDKASLRVRKNSQITLSNNSYFDKGTLLRLTDNAKFTIGKNSGFNSFFNFSKIFASIFCAPPEALTWSCLWVSGRILVPILTYVCHEFD